MITTDSTPTPTPSASPAATREAPPVPTAEDMDNLAGDFLGIVLGPGEGARLIGRSLELWGNAGAPPVPQQAAEITREQAVAIYSEVMAVHACQTLGDMAERFARAVWAAAQAARPEPAPPPQLPPEQEFPLRLYQLLEQFDAELFYTTRDDGIQISVGPHTPFAGFMSRAELRDELIKDGLLPDPDQLNGWDAAAGEVQP